ncbi:hypothetical protein H5410_027035 [Solanum commersonii]|uniref:Uncharacterized protein n=1 Tax=Solanum commersonii TaxID=4109 RepID=A0A9J5Z0T3_SOLCO|nr:hypothetical protein H5410_027035 [Solanum commersonii]
MTITLHNLDCLRRILTDPSQMDHCLWMYNIHYETGAGLKPEFIDGVRNFIEHTMTLDIFKINGLVRVMVHLYRNGFKPRYFVWIDHGESSMHVDVYNMVAPHGQIRVKQVRVEHDRVVGFMK